MALLLGDANRAKPRPASSRLATSQTGAVVADINMKKNRLRAEHPMPREATSRGSRRSDRVPARGDSIAMSRGWARRIRPAAWESYPLTT